MFNLDRWQEIFETIRHHKLRTFLTALSVAWGIFMLVVLLGAGSGLQNSSEDKFKDDAVNSLWIWPGRTSIAHEGHASARPILLHNEDHEAIATQVHGVEHITSRFRVWGDYVVKYGNKNGSYRVRSVHPAHQFLENTKIIRGRFLNELDMQQRRKVAVVGTDIVTALFGAKSPIGEYLNIAGIQYRVVGVFDDDGGERERQMIYIPISTAQMAYNGQERVHMVMFTIGDGDVNDSYRMVNDVTQLMAERHHFDPNDKQALRIRNNVERFQEISDLFFWIKMFIWIIGVGTIVAGIVGVSNIMLISVKERTKEIGVRKALGATPWSIIALVVQEAVFITGVAGYWGLIAGVAAVELVARYMPENDHIMNPEVDLGAAVWATVLLIVCGALAGFFPARRAAAVQPVVALRDE